MAYLSIFTAGSNYPVQSMPLAGRNLNHKKYQNKYQKDAKGTCLGNEAQAKLFNSDTFQRNLEP